MRQHVPFALVLAGAIFLGATGATQRFDAKLLDLQFRALRTWFPQPVERDVVVVGVDDETVRLFPEPVTLWHGHFGRFLSAMAAVQPAVVGLDIILPDRSYDGVVPGSDKKLLKGLLDARPRVPVVLGQTIEPSGRPRALHPLFQRLAAGTGYALFPADADGVVRRFDERLVPGSEAVPTFTGEVARKLGIEARAGYIDYWRGGALPYVPLHRALQWADSDDEQALRRSFGGKAVLVGMVLPFEDRLPAPVPLAAWEPEASRVPGVLVHAQALRNLLNGGFARSAPAWTTLALCVALAALWFVSTGTALAAALLALAAIGIGAFSTWLLAHGWVFPPLAPALTAALALGGRNAHDTLLKLRERRRLRSSFGGYVSPPVMEEILAGRVRPGPGGENRYVCVLFSDIRGYTTRSEAMTAEQVIAFLNRYFERTVGLIHARGGAVVSFMGDGIMAVFGAPKAVENPCRDAFEAARDMLHHVAALNADLRAENVPPVEIGIGLHAGEAVVGHVGSAARHDYTAIGDVTNVASRVEGLTKEAGYRVVVTCAVADKLGGEITLAPLGPMAIKGHSPVEVYGHDKI